MKYVYGKKLKSFRQKLTTLIASAAILTNSMGVALPMLLTQKAAATPISVNTVTASDITGDSITLNFNVVSDLNSLPGSTGIFETQIDSNPVVEYSFPIGTTAAPFTGVNSYVQVREQIVTDDWTEVWTDWQRFEVLTASDAPSFELAGSTENSVSVKVINPTSSSVAVDMQVDGTGSIFNYFFDPGTTPIGPVTAVEFIQLRFVAFDLDDEGSTGTPGPWQKFYVTTPDTTKPVVTLTEPLTDSYNPSQIIVEAEDETSLYRVTANIYNQSNTTLLESCSELAGGATTYTLTCTVPTLADGVYTIRANAQDNADPKHTASTITRQFTVDHTGPTITVKPESVGTPDVFSKVSFKLFDAHKIDKVTINGVTKDLSNNKWSDVNNIVPGVLGAVEGENTIVAYDVAGNTTSYTFILDTTAPTLTVKSGSNYTVGGGDTFSKVSFKLFDSYKIKGYTLNGNWKPLTPNKWSDANFIAIGHMGGIEGENIIVLEDLAGNKTTFVFYLAEEVPAAIVLPVVDHVMNVGQVLSLEAHDTGAASSGVQWAVREGTCAANTNTVAGNVDGFSDTFSWVAGNFTSSLDTDNWIPGVYCFVFNPIDGERLTRNFTVGAALGVSTDIPNTNNTTNDNDPEQETLAGNVLGVNTGIGGGQVLGASTNGLTNTGTQMTGLVTLVAAGMVGFALILIRRKQEN